MTTDCQSQTRSMVLTSPGSGAIAVIRVAGPAAIGVVESIFRTERGGSLSRTAANRLRYGTIRDDDERVDDVIAVTCRVADQDVVDLCTHGGVRVVQWVLDLLSRSGAPLVDPTDASAVFQQPANVIEQEAIEGMARVQTHRGLHMLAWQRRHLPPALTLLSSQCRSDPKGARAALQQIAGRYANARRLLDGATISIHGPPNCGKSTLFNRLVGREDAVVSSTAGTTRDWVSAGIEIDGVPVTLLDTAGAADTADPLDQLAIEAGESAGRKASIRIVVVDRSTPFSKASWARLASLRAGSSAVFVANKADLPPRVDPSGLPDMDWIEVSAATGCGFDALVRRISAELGIVEGFEAAPCLFTRRQLEAAEVVLATLANDPALAGALITAQLIGPRVK